MASESLLGLDIGSSSVKACLLDAATGRELASAVSPETELDIIAHKAGWAEQDPGVWWEHAVRAVRMIGEKAPGRLKATAAVGISYQMHGLVLLDKEGAVLRPSIIWCDSRAVPYGTRAFEEIGRDTCLTRLLNSPGNFTAAKLAWVKEHEPEVFSRVAKFMLPGDYIAYRMSGTICTTPSGLSEGILWDSQRDGPADFLLDYFGFPRELVPEVRPAFSIQAKVHAAAAGELGIPSGTPVSYRAGDQPNNAFSLGVLKPGELATTAGTSGVVYGIAGEPLYDPLSRVNTFVHVNHSKKNNRFGVLLCLNGTGILNRWIKQHCTGRGKSTLSYEEMNQAAASVPVGSEGLLVMPYGNGAERTLENRDPGASFHNINFNIHTQAHYIRAAQEGIVFALNYGLDIMRGMGMKIETVKAGYANMFLSPLFREAFSTITGTEVLLYNTDGSQGAARGASIGAGLVSDPEQAFTGLEEKARITPSADTKDAYSGAYTAWREVLEKGVLN